MFRHLLLPLSGTDLDREAVEHARSLALSANADLHLMRVLEPPDRGPDAGPVDTLEWHARRVAAEEALEAIAADLRGSGVQVETSCAEGRAAEHIIHQVHRGIDFMILPVGRFGGLAEGGTAGQVLWRSYVTTLLVRPHRSPGTGPHMGQRAAGEVPAPTEDATAEQEWSQPAGDTGTEVQQEPAHGRNPMYGNVLVCLDGSRRSECVLPVVRFLASTCGAQVVLAHVVEEPPLPRLVPPTPEESELVARLTAINERAASDYLDDVASRLGFDVGRRLRRGKSIAAALHAIVDEVDPDLVVMSAHGDGGDQSWPFGEVATNLIGYGRRPLLLVHDVPWTERTGTATDVTDEAWGW